MVVHLDVQPGEFHKEIALLRQRLDDRLEGATAEDRRFVLKAVGTRVIVQADGSRELELQMPREVAEPAEGFHIVNSRLWWKHTVIHI